MYDSGGHRKRLKPMQLWHNVNCAEPLKMQQHSKLKACSTNALQETILCIFSKNWTQPLCVSWAFAAFDKILLTALLTAYHLCVYTLHLGRQCYCFFFVLFGFLVSLCQSPLSLHICECRCAGRQFLGLVLQSLENGEKYILHLLTFPTVESTPVQKHFSCGFLVLSMVMCAAKALCFVCVFAFHAFDAIILFRY